MIRLAILGYGKLGAFLHEQFTQDSWWHDKLEVAFIWNRSENKTEHLSNDNQILVCCGLKHNLVELIKSQNIDLVIESSHANITIQYAAEFLKIADFMPTSLTAFADVSMQQLLIERKNEKQQHKLLIPTGAGWGFSDIQRLSAVNKLKQVQIAMYFGYSALKITDEQIKQALENYGKSDDQAPFKVAEGNVFEIAQIAPQNVNTMIGLSLSLEEKDKNKITGQLFASKHAAHRVEITIFGDDGFEVKTTRINPAKKGAVTGNMTFYSFLSSIRSFVNTKNDLQIF